MTFEPIWIINLTTSHDKTANDSPLSLQISGTPVEGYKRLQFSLKIEPISEFDIMSQMPSVLFPLIWVEESVQLNKTYTNLLKYQLFL